jgi:hypothetical protein
LFALIPVPEGIRDLSYDLEKQKTVDVKSAETESS